MNPQEFTSILDYINPIKLFPYPELWGILLYFLVPLLLWLGCAFWIGRKNKKYSVFAFIAGSDNRLSLSRLQAFMWTLVIFGSFVAAMAIHTKITPLTKAANAKAEAKANSTAILRDGYKSIYENALINFTKDPNNEENKKNLEKAAAEYNDAVEAANAAAILYQFSNWVSIPAELLALAGIAIGSGVFSSVISAVNNEEKSARANSIAPLTEDEFNEEFPNVPHSPNEKLLLIKGEDFGKKGEVRFAKGKSASTYAPAPGWNENNIAVEAPNNGYDTIVIDTENGKLCYYLENAQSDKPQLSKSMVYYEFADLFRDDKNPQNMSLMKFQMFGWTVVALVVYSWLFLYDLNDHISSLPIVPTAIVILTGLSQGGYLAGKGVSNISPREEK